MTTVLQTDTGAVWLYDDMTGDLRMVAASGWCRHTARSILARGEGITGTVFATAATHIEEDVALSSRLLETVRPQIPVGPRRAPIA